MNRWHWAVALVAAFVLLVAGGAVRRDPLIQSIISETTYCYPLVRRGSIVGGPYQGTHTLGNWQSDNAVDFGVPIGTTVIAVAPGYIGSRIGSLGRGGRYAGLRLTLVTRDNEFYYAHLSRLRVRSGQRVVAGQPLGRSGSAGIAHLHFSSRNGDPVDISRVGICEPWAWRLKKRYLWLRWFLGEGEFKKFGSHRERHRPEVPRRVPKFVWVWAEHHQHAHQ